jgi:hypothetical protein
LRGASPAKGALWMRPDADTGVTRLNLNPGQTPKPSGAAAPSTALRAVPLRHFMGEDKPAAAPSSHAAIGHPAGRPSFDELLRRGRGTTRSLAEGVRLATRHPQLGSYSGTDFGAQRLENAQPRTKAHTPFSLPTRMNKGLHRSVASIGMSPAVSRKALELSCPAGDVATSRVTPFRWDLSHENQSRRLPRLWRAVDD